MATDAISICSPSNALRFTLRSAAAVAASFAPIIEPCIEWPCIPLGEFVEPQPVITTAASSEALTDRTILIFISCSSFRLGIFFCLC